MLPDDPGSPEAWLIIEKLLEFLGISSPEQWEYYINKNTNFLRSTAFQENIEHISSFHSPHKAVIIMSMRYKTNDHFWFTFFHEIDI